MRLFRQRSLRSQSDEALYRALCDGDRSALEVLYDRYFDRLSWYAIQFLGEEETARDLVQDVFLKIIQKPASFDTQRNFATWVYSVVSNACKSQLRSGANRRRILSGQAAGAIQQPVSNHSSDLEWKKKLMAHAFTGLSEREQLLFVFRFQYELKIREIAKRMELPEGTVKSGLYNLLKKLNQALKAHKDEFEY